MRLLLIAAAFLLIAVAPATARAASDVVADFNGDGHADLAVGAPMDSVSGYRNAGAVNVIHGSPDGLRSDEDQQFTQDSPGVPGAAEAVDRFGAALGTGDFDGDGHGDLAVGIPGEDVPAAGPGEIRNAGAVVILYGGVAGLRPRGRLWTQDAPWVKGRAEVEDDFGAALAAGDFGGDGRDDLAVGAPDDSVSGHIGAGAVSVFYGRAHGLSRTDDLFTLDTARVKGRAARFFRFGYALAAGDVSANGHDDLAVGIPGGRIDGAAAAGAVSVLFGRSGGLSTVDQLWSQGARGVAGTADPGDGLGRTVAIGDFDGDGIQDLAAGVPFEDAGGIRDAGAVNVLRGATVGLRPDRDVLWTRRRADVGEPSREHDYWGTAVDAGDFDADGADDLLVGGPGVDVARAADAGSVTVLHAALDGRARADANGWWHQGSPGIAGRPEPFDDFGDAVTTGDFDGDGADDAAVGAPRDSVAGSRNGGAVNVLYGERGRGLHAGRDELWTQATPGVLGAVGDDWFGLALAR
jgi:hypothetical protein